MQCADVRSVGERQILRAAFFCRLPGLAIRPMLDLLPRAIIGAQAGRERVGLASVSLRIYTFVFSPLRVLHSYLPSGSEAHPARSSSEHNFGVAVGCPYDPLIQHDARGDERRIFHRVWTVQHIFMATFPGSLRCY